MSQDVTMFITTDREHNAIYSIGKTEDDALQAARDAAGDPEHWSYTVLPATERLCAAVEDRGGGPGDVRWTIVRECPRYADLLVEDEDGE